MQLRQVIALNIKRFRNFIGFSQGYIKRHDPIKNLQQSIIGKLKEFLTINKKIKMSKYRVTYHRRQLQKMESLIASNSDHVFLQGQKLNQLR